MKLKLTKAVIEAIEPPESGVLFVRDAELPGFALRVTANGAKSYVVERKMDGKTVRATVGRVGVVTLPDARIQGMRLLAGMAAGQNPHDARRDAAPVEVVTLDALFEDYLTERTRTDPPLKPRTVDDYRKLWKYLADWHALPADRIDATMVIERHKALTAKPSGITANRVMRTLSAVMNYALNNEQYLRPGGAPLIVLNPVVVLRQRRLWNRERRRKSYLDAALLPLWWALVDDVTDARWPDRWEVVRDYWRFLLFTGMRSFEAARLEVAKVNLRRGTFEVEDTKNRETFEVPVGPWVRAMLERRVAAAKKIGSPWVFPAPKREAGHTSPAHDIREILVAKHDLAWSPHDLRRTFATWLDSLEVSSFVVKRLLNHKSGAGGDVTAGYVQSDIERLRPIVDRLEAKLLGMCCPEEGAPAGETGAE